MYYSSAFPCACANRKLERSDRYFLVVALSTVHACQIIALRICHLLQIAAQLHYPLAWHGMALNPPLMTAFFHEDSAPDCGIMKTIHTYVI